MTWYKPSSLFPLNRDYWLTAVAATAGILASTVILTIFAFLIWESLPALWQIQWRQWFSDPSWYPSLHQFNLLPMIAGSAVVAGGAVLLTTPIGIASAIFLRFYAPKAAAILYRRILELLGGIPSVVYGFWGLVVLVPLINQWSPPGQSILAGILVLSLMILPLVALVTDAALQALPRDLVQGAFALGLSKRAALTRVLLPAARNSIVSGVLLQLARAVGETMVVLMVCGNILDWPGGIFDPIRTLTANIALEMAYATDIHRASLFVTGLVLLTAAMLLVFSAQALHRPKVEP